MTNFIIGAISGIAALVLVCNIIDIIIAGRIKKDLVIDESYPFFNLHKRMLDGEPEFTYCFKEGEYDLKSLQQAYENKELFYNHYIISKINEAGPCRPFSLTFTKID